MAKRATMTDIAERAGVSQATVSLVLNNIPNVRVAKETRQRIIDAAFALGYEKGLRPGAPETGTRVIGLLIDELGTTAFSPPLLEGAAEEAALHGCVVASFRTRSDPTLEVGAIESLKRLRLLGVIFAALTTRVVELPAGLEKIPTVLLNCHSRSRQHQSIVPADLAGAYTATEALLKAGHRRIAHIAGETWMDAGKDRERGYRQALSNWDVAIDPALIKRGAWTLHGGRELALELLDLPDPPTAIFCFNDRMAVGAYDAIHSRGLRIPDDISVVGFDNEEDLVSHLIPPLSTILLPHEDMARQAVRSLVEFEETHTTVSRVRLIKVECPLVMRDSIAAQRRRPRRVTI